MNNTKPFCHICGREKVLGLGEFFDKQTGELEQVWDCPKHGGERPPEQCLRQGHQYVFTATGFFAKFVEWLEGPRCKVCGDHQDKST